MDDDLSREEIADRDRVAMDAQLEAIQAELAEVIAEAVKPDTVLQGVEVRLINYGRQFQLRTRWTGASPRYLREIATISGLANLEDVAGRLELTPAVVTKALKGVLATYEMMMEPRPSDVG